MKIAAKDPTTLVPYVLNNKKHSSRQINAIVQSIKEFGFVQPVVVDRDDVIVIGHARVEAAKKIGLETVPVLVLEDATDHQVKRLRLMDNRLSDLGDYDVDAIRSELDALGDEDLVELFKGLDLEEGGSMGDYQDTSVKDSLKERFGVPPFSILDSRQGYWTSRKAKWKELIADDGKTRENVLFKEGTSAMSKIIGGLNDGVSIFDPVLAELIVRWFCPTGGKVFDTFAGGASGFVYGFLGHPFTGIELRREQAEINNARLERHGLLTDECRYVCDDGRNVRAHVEKESQDLFFSCPPYFDLEQYSDDPRDGSNMPYEDFRGLLDEAFTGAAEALKDNRFAVVVMSNVRDEKGFYRDICGDIKAIMARNGLRLYNEISFINAIGTLPLRVNNAMKNRKVGRVHQEVLVFFKGDTGETVYEKHGFDLMDKLRTVQFHEEVMVFYKGDPKDIQKHFKPIDFSEEAAASEAGSDGEENPVENA